MLEDIRRVIRGETTVADKNLKIFALMLLIYQVIIIIVYALFVRVYPFPLEDKLSSLRWTAFQDI